MSDRVGKFQIQQTGVIIYLMSISERTEHKLTILQPNNLINKIMKQFTKTILFLFVIGIFSSGNAQTTIRNKTVVQTNESLTTIKDSTGIHYITTIQKDSIVEDSTYRTKTVNTKTVVYKGNSKETTEISSTTRTKTKKD